MLVSHGAMVMVIDGARRSLFRNRGTDVAIDLEFVENETKHVENTAALGTDKPGRSFNTTGPGRSAYQSTDFHQAAEAAFAAAAAEQLNGLAQQADLDFIVVATPRVLGVMRHHYSDDLKKRLTAEIDKDYAGRPAADIAHLLRHHEM